MNFSTTVKLPRPRTLVSCELQLSSPVVHINLSNFTIVTNLSNFYLARDYPPTDLFIAREEQPTRRRRMKLSLLVGPWAQFIFLPKLAMVIGCWGRGIHWTFLRGTGGREDQRLWQVAGRGRRGGGWQPERCSLGRWIGRREPLELGKMAGGGGEGCEPTMARLDAPYPSPSRSLAPSHTPTPIHQILRSKC